MDDPLAALRPLHVPPPISWWPPAPGWWLLLLTIVVVAGGVFWWRRASAVRRAALGELRALEQAEAPPERKVALLNRLLKRYALVCAPAVVPAALTGRRWLEFLDAHGGRGEFSRGVGRVLLTLPYGGAGEPDMTALFELARRWIKTNRELR